MGISQYVNPRIPTSLQGVSTTGMVATPTSQAGLLTASTTSSSYQTAVNLSAPGVLTLAGMYNVSGSPISGATVRITVDGTVIRTQFAATLSHQDAIFPVGSLAFNSSGTTLALDYLPFQTLHIEFLSDGANTLNVAYRYFLT